MWYNYVAQRFNNLVFPTLEYRRVLTGPPLKKKFFKCPCNPLIHLENYNSQYFTMSSFFAGSDIAEMPVVVFSLHYRGSGEGGLGNPSSVDVSELFFKVHGFSALLSVRLMSEFWVEAPVFVTTL